MKLIIHSDGGSRGNPGPAAAGVVISDAKGKKLLARGFFLGEGTNNFAEYQGLLLALQHAARLNGTELEISCDSELIVKQVKGEYRVKNPSLQKICREILDLIDDFKTVNIKHVRRCHNAHADQLVNQALDAGCDVDGCLSGNQANDPAPSAVTFIDLLKESQFRPDQPQKLFFPMQDKLRAGLLCLDRGQHYSIESHWREATITIIRGRGTITVENEIRPAAQGLWLHLKGIRTAQITADPDEQFIALVTYLT